MRLIDADKLHPDSMTNKGTVAISQSQIANAKTVEAVPLSVIEKIKAEIDSEISECVEQPTTGTYLIATGLDDAKEIIDEAVKEYTHERT